MEHDNGHFTYTYSAKQQEEVKRIRQKYIPPAQNKMEQLRKLDESAEKPGQAVSIAVGTVGTLLLGVGMSCTMVWAERYFIPGIVIGVIGIAVVGIAYPIYKMMTKKRREQLAPQIMKLSEELIHNTD